MKDDEDIDYAIRKVKLVAHNELLEEVNKQ